MRKIGVLTSGGDAPGMNAAIRSVVRMALSSGMEVCGIRRGYTGLITGQFESMTARSVSDILHRGGTILQSSRCPEFCKQEGVLKGIERARKEGIEGIVVIGGDGSFRGACALSLAGMPTIGIPGTIDNDITATDYTIGLDTSTNTTLRMIDNLKDTCESHARLNVVEVMGRDCGQIALYAAIASGAVAVAIPEVPFDEEAAIKKIADLREWGKRGMIVVVSEGVVNPDGSRFAEGFAKRIEEQTGVETKFARFSHVVRGGRPTMRDRATAAHMGVRAVELLAEGKSNVVMCELNGLIRPVDINFALIADRMYKNKLKDGDLDSFTPEQLEGMKQLCEKRREEIENLYKVAGHVGFR